MPAAEQRIPMQYEAHMRSSAKGYRLLGHETATITREDPFRVSFLPRSRSTSGGMSSWRQSHLLGSRLEIPNIRFLAVGFADLPDLDYLRLDGWVGPSLPRSRYVGTGIARSVAPRRRTAVVPPR